VTTKQFFLLAAILAIMTLAACGGGASVEPMAVTLHAKDIAFDTTAIHALPDQTVTVTLINDGTLDHGFVIDGLFEQQLVTAGKTITFSFKTGAAGELQFYCPVAGHKEAGMVGTLTVAP
jgi:plastocyanin